MQYKIKRRLEYTVGRGANQPWVYCVKSTKNDSSIVWKREQVAKNEDLEILKVTAKEAGKLISNLKRIGRTYEYELVNATA